MPSSHPSITDLLGQRILILDGAMGTMIQRYKLAEEDYRGEPFKDWPSDLKGNNDLLALTKPEVIRAIHDQYLESGADILETNTFNGNRLSQADYGLADHTVAIVTAAALLARAAADEWTAKTPEKPRFVAGVLGPTSKTASISPEVNDPGARNTSFDELVEIYAEATRAPDRGQGGCDSDRNRLRHTQCQGRRLRRRSGLRGGRHPPAGDDLGHHHRRLRAHPLRSDRGSLLQQPAPRPAAVDRAQLRARDRTRCGRMSRTWRGSPSSIPRSIPTPGSPTRWASTT